LGGGRVPLQLQNVPPRGRREGLLVKFTIISSSSLK
jgi:hypothetical protein